MVEGKLAIRALGDTEVDNNLHKIGDSRVEGRRFTEVGSFSMVDTLYRRLKHQMWAQKLLIYDPKETSLWAEGEQIMVRDQANHDLTTILPGDIRTIGKGSGRGSVRESGYILINGEFWFGNGRKGMQISELEQTLIAAERGIRKPPYFSPETFVKVDPALYGQTLWVGIFAKELDRDAWDREAVVIDPQERKMIAREVVRPLDKANWGL